MLRRPCRQQVRFATPRRFDDQGQRSCAATAAGAFCAAASVGSLRSSPELRASAPIVVPRSGGGFDESNAGGSNFALSARVSASLAFRKAPRAGAERGR